MMNAFRCFLAEGHKIGTPGPLIREIKQDEINALKARFAGRSQSKSPPKTVTPGKDQVQDLENQVTAQGDAVRKLKESKADKAVIKEAVDKLLALKKDLALAQGKDPNETVGNTKKGKKK
jgi:methionyl-tRNA synthetase